MVYILVAFVLLPFFLFCYFIIRLRRVLLFTIFTFPHTKFHTFSRFYRLELTGWENLFCFGKNGKQKFSSFFFGFLFFSFSFCFQLTVVSIRMIIFVSRRRKNWMVEKHKSEIILFQEPEWILVAMEIWLVDVFLYFCVILYVYAVMWGRNFFFICLVYKGMVGVCAHKRIFHIHRYFILYALVCVCVGIRIICTIIKCVMCWW